MRAHGSLETDRFSIEPRDNGKGPRVSFRSTEETAIKLYHAGPWSGDCVLRRLIPGAAGVVVASKGGGL